jgi:predicted TIM-barrel fold metal-dependent hydrolase
MDHQLTVLKRSNQKLERKPSEYLRDIYLDMVSPLAEAMQFAVEFSGPGKLLFSSDHPWVLPKYIIEPMRSLNLPEPDEQKIFRQNAWDLFQLGT